MKFSIFSVMLPDYTPEQLVQLLKTHGYDGVEWRVGQALKEVPDPLPARNMRYWQANRATLDEADILRQAKHVAALCAEHNLEHISLGSYVPIGEFERIERLLEAARSSGCRMVRLFPYRFEPGMDYPSLLSKAREELKTVEQLARKYAAAVTLEIHMDTIIPSASAAMRLIDGLDSAHIGVVYDAGNMVHEGYEQYDMGIKMLGPYVHHVHIKDACWSLTPSPSVEWCPIGQGRVQFDRLLKALNDIGYNRYLSFEDFSCKESDDAKLSHNISFIKSLIS